MTELLVTATALLCAVFLIRALLGRHVSMRLRYSLWGLVLLRLLLPVTFLQSPASVMNALPAGVPVLRTAAEPAVPAVPAEEGAPLLQSAPAPRAPIQAPAPYPAPAEPEPAPVSSPPAREPLSPQTVLFALWLSGAALVGGYFLLTNLRFYARLRRARRPVALEGCPLPVYRADFLPSPCLCGLLRPAVYLNAAALAGPATLRHVLIHELCHRRHLDNLWALLRGVCLSLWWFHPLVWWAAVLSRRDCELACDEAAVKDLGEAQRIPYGQTLISMVAARRPGPGDLLSASTAMTEGARQIKERVIQVSMKRRIKKTAVSLALVLSLLAGLCTFTGAVAQSALSPLPCPVAADPDLRLSALDLSAVSLPDFGWTGTRTAYEREVLIRYMAEYGKQFYALPGGSPWKALDVQVVPNKFKGLHSGPLGDPDWTPGENDRPYEPGNVSHANDWVTLAVRPAGGMDAVRPLFQGGVPRGTGAYADYVLLQYHVTLELENGAWTASRNRDGSVLYVSPAWNTVPPPDRGEWTESRLETWRSDLSIDLSPMVEGDGPAAWQEAGELWAEYFTNQFLRFGNTGHPGMSDDVQVLAVDLEGYEPEAGPETLFFHIQFAFRPIWGLENGAAFIAAYSGGPGGNWGYEGELADYVVVDAAVTLVRDETRNVEGKTVWKGFEFETQYAGNDQNDMSLSVPFMPNGW